MAWIERQWDTKYIADAKAKVIETVSVQLHKAVTNMPSGYSIKMSEYHRKLNSDLNNVLPSRRQSTGVALRYMELSSKYGLPNDLDIRNLGPKEQTVEQEYHTYAMAPCSEKGTDVLKFWEVSIIYSA
jgi:hypothetical protein